MGRFGAISFHETKNAIAGEGGALLINDVADVRRAEICGEGHQPSGSSGRGPRVTIDVIRRSSPAS
jgi:dTDP-4-amino-4,6-dideoxygalactose transaminase